MRGARTDFRHRSLIRAARDHHAIDVQALAQLLIANGFQNVEFTPDLQGIPRVVSAQRL